MQSTTTGQSAQDRTPLATVFGRSLVIPAKGGVTITDHNARPRELLSRRAVQLQSLLTLTTDVEEFDGYADTIQGGILGLAADLANDIHLIVRAMDSSAEGGAA